MTREEKQKAIDVLKISAPVMAVTQEEFNDYIQTLNKIMDWLEQEPCADAISREAVAEVLLKYAHSEVGKAFAEFLISQINALPPVTPKQTFEGMTNGEVIQALFPKIKVKPLVGVKGLLHVFFDKKEDNAFDEDWWNAPYKGGKQNDD